MTQRIPSTKADWVKVATYYVGAMAAYATLSIPLFRHMAIPSHYSFPKALSVYVIVIAFWFALFFLAGLAFSIFLALVGKTLKTEKWANIFRRGVFVGLIFSAVLAAGGWYSYAADKSLQRQTSPVKVKQRCETKVSGTISPFVRLR